MKPWPKYFLLGFLFFVIVDFLTTEALVHPAKYYSTFMPLMSEIKPHLLRCG